VIRGLGPTRLSGSEPLASRQEGGPAG